MGTRMPVKTRSTTGPVDLAVRFNRGDHGAHARRRENSRHGRSDGKVDEEERAMRLQLRNLTKGRSEEHTSELQSLMRISYAVFCLKKKKTSKKQQYTLKHTTIMRHI